MSASAAVISYQVSNRVPTSADVRAYIKRSLAPYVEAAKAAEAARPAKPAVGTVFRAGKAAVIYTRVGYLAIEGPVADYDARLAESGGRLYNSERAEHLAKPDADHSARLTLSAADGRPYFASIQEWCAHIGASEEDVTVE